MYSIAGSLVRAEGGSKSIITRNQTAPDTPTLTKIIHPRYLWVEVELGWTAEGLLRRFVGSDISVRAEPTTERRKRIIGMGRVLRIDLEAVLL